MRFSKKAARFGAEQKAYLDEKFKIGEQTRFKADPAQVAQDMRHAKHDEFLAPQQIKSYFSRMTVKLHQGSHEVEDEWNTQAVVEQHAYSSSRTHILQECQPIHHSLMIHTTSVNCTQEIAKLSVPILHLICSHFEMEIDNLPLRLKKPYVKLIEELVRSCSCA